MHEISRTTPDSWRVLREAMGDKRKYVAHVIRRSGNQVDHWCISPPTADNPDSSGDINPLDFLICLLRACGDVQARYVVDWLCRQFGGRFVPSTGGTGDGKLFREPGDAIPHLKALLIELKKTKPSARVVRAHLEEAFVILSAHFQEDGQNGHNGQNGDD